MSIPPCPGTRIFPRNTEVDSDMRRIPVWFFFAFVVLLAGPLGAVVNFRTTGIGNVRLTVSNMGMLGTSFDLPGYPSCEYPRESGTERLDKAGIWIAAKVSDPTDSLRITSAVTNSATYGVGSEGFEFIPSPSAADTIRELSTLLTSPYYAPQDAVSEQDFVAHFTDYLWPQGPPVNHRPLGADVTLTSHAWSYDYIDDVVILEYTIVNTGLAGAWRDVYVGMYAELVSGNETFWGDAFATSPFFQHKRLFYNDTLRLMYERNDGYDLLAQGYGGFQFLGVIRGQEWLPADSFQTVFIWWPWQPANYQGWTDATWWQNYILETQNYPPMDDAYVQQNGYPDPVGFLKVGPFPFVGVGETLRVVFAFVGGLDDQHLESNAGWAKRAFLSQYILPAPPPSPRLAVVTDHGVARIYFDDSPEGAVEPNTGEKDFEGYRIYRRKGTFTTEDSGWVLVAEYDKQDDVGYNTGLPPRAVDGPYAGWYVVEDRGVHDGEVYTYAVTSFDRGNPDLGLSSLESSRSQNATTITVAPQPTDRLHPAPVQVFPNPYRKSSPLDGPTPFDRKLVFQNLPRRCRISIYTLSGDLVKVIEHDDPLKGQETWNLITRYDQEAATGLYLFVVEDLETGDRQKGQFLILK